jgi:trehalose synthase
MLQKTQVEERYLKDYKDIILPALYDEIQSYAEKLKGAKVYHLNATAVGGGVAEILAGLVPLMKDLGIDAEWLTIPPDDDFFNVTKEMHNTLQGKKADLTPEQEGIYTRYNERLAKLMKDTKPDLWLIHDPQPAASIHFLNDRVPAIWRCHIDTTNRRESVWNFVKKFLDKYRYFVFSLEQFVPRDLDKKRVVVSPPAIDPLSVKNVAMEESEAKKVIGQCGVDPSRPLITQVSRFDPWKDPKGVIDAFRLARREIDGLQLAMVGLIIAHDDPEAFEIFDDVKEYAGDDPDIHLFADPENIPVDNDTFVKAFQGGSDVIMQKSIREGFGLVVTEALWKGKPVIGGNVGGIKLQIENGVNGFLVGSSEEASEKAVYLLKHPEKLVEMGKNAREVVRRKFLLPRLLCDYLHLCDRILN